jgi:hypothetical protein
LAERREQLELLSRTLDREAHILMREPEVLPSHLHNMLYLDEGENGPAGPLLGRAREALAERPWLCLTNRPAVQRSALIRVLEHRASVKAIAWSPDGAILARRAAKTAPCGCGTRPRGSASPSLERQTSGVYAQAGDSALLSALLAAACSPGKMRCSSVAC